MEIAALGRLYPKSPQARRDAEEYAIETCSDTLPLQYSQDDGMAYL